MRGCERLWTYTTNLQSALLFSALLLLSGCGAVSSSTPTPSPTPNPSPSLTSVTPTSTLAGSASLMLTVNGSGFLQSSTMQWNQANRTPTFLSSTQLQLALTPADLASGEIVQIFVVNPTPGGGTSSAGTFTINNPAPQITGVSPSTATIATAPFVVTITGSGFLSSSTVTCNGAVRVSTYLSATQLNVALLASDLATIGAAQIAVTNPAPGGGATPPTPIVIGYPVPKISSLNVVLAPVGGGPPILTVNGVGFASSSVVQVNGAARSTTYVNSSTLTALLTPGDVIGTGNPQVTVVTGPPGGGTSAPALLTLYAVPSITSISPTSITVNSPDTLVSIFGSGFTPASTVQINGGNALNNNGGYDTQLLFTVPTADLASLGSLSITVSNPGTAASNALTINVTPNPAPTLSSISPNSAAVGGADFTLNVFGSNFVPASLVRWNESPRPTTFVNSSQLTAAIPSKDIQTLGNSTVTIFNPAPGGGESAASAFTTYVGLPANDIDFSQSTQLIYASVPSEAGPTLGNSIVSIDPYTGALGTPVFVGSEPGKMALSSDGNTIWVALNAAAAVRQVNLVTHTAGTQIGLGGGTGVYNPPRAAQALAVMPGHPDTVAIAAPTSFTYSSVVTIYDSGIARANGQSSTLPCCSGILGMAFDPTGTKLYEAGSGYGVATVDSTGITSASSLNPNVSTQALRIDNGRAYLTTGVILDANSGTQLGVFSVTQNQNANGPVAPDSSIGEGFVLANPSFGSAYQINAYDLATFVLKGSSQVAISNSFPQGPQTLIRWGQDGLAFSTGTQVYIVRSTLVRDLSGSLADLSVSASASPSDTTGTNLTYALTVKNAGPLAATPATLIDDVPNGSTLQSATPSQGTCNPGSVVLCDLGNLSSGGSATIQIIVTPLSAGTLTNTATVSAPQGDPNPANNTVVSTTTVTGSTYNPGPSMTSISPDFVPAGSGSLTLTVNGAGFVSGSTVQLNSTALSTTFVSATQLSAAVPAANVASMGWSWINVTNPTPGGGTSSSLPLTTYAVISLDVNRLSFDPFTGKLYASVPSTATQVKGNSLVAIDPASASIGTPLNIGSEPNHVAESNDGKYLYVGLDGSQSLTRVDLTSMTQGPVYPIVIPGVFGPPTQVAARDLAVAPGNDSLLAIDTGSFSGNGLFDISGSTATMRSHLTGPYTGSSLTFANSSTLYSYDSDTSGAEFYRWTVTSTGLTLDNNTGYTLNGIGGFAGSYKLVNGIVYGFSGGVADPTTTPPTQLGQFSVNPAQGAGQIIEGSGVAPDPALGRVFIQGETLAGTANPVLLSFDSKRYVLLGMEQFTGAAQGVDLVRWGRDGLAWHSSMGAPFGNSTPGTGQIFLMRGPFVLPEWSTANPTPGLVSASPSSVAAGSGNLTVTIVGSNLVPGAVLTWNGSERTTTFVDSSHLSVAIPASDVSKTGTATLVVNNPGSTDSISISFAIN